MGPKNLSPVSIFTLVSGLFFLPLACSWPTRKSTGCIAVYCRLDVFVSCFQELCCGYALSRIKAVFLLCVSYRVAWSLFCQKMKFPWLCQLHLLRTWSWVVTMERFAFCSAGLLTRLLLNLWSISKWKQNYTQNRWGIKGRERCLEDMARFPVSLKSRKFRLEIKWNGPFRFFPIGIFGTTSEGGPFWTVLLVAFMSREQGTSLFCWSIHSQQSKVDAFDEWVGHFSGDFSFNLASAFDANQTPDDLGKVCKTGLGTWSFRNFIP